MDYFKQRRAFRKRLTNELHLSTGQILLYIQLLDYANDESHLDSSFKLKNSVLESLTGLTRQGLYTARNRLIQESLIRVTKGKKDHEAPNYQIIKLYQNYNNQVTRQSPSSLPDSYRTVDTAVATSVDTAVDHKNLLVLDYDQTKTIKDTPKPPTPGTARQPIPNRPAHGKHPNKPSHKAEVEAVLAELNTQAQAHYRSSSKSTQRFIEARLAEGFTLADLKKVIHTKVQEWGNDPMMSKYLRPETLFCSKFEGYLNQTPSVPRQQEKQPTWLQEDYTPPKPHITAEKRAKLAGQLAALNRLKTPRETAHG